MLNIIVPVYNEGKNIQALCDEIANSIHIPLEMIIAFDFDADDTLPVIRQIHSKYQFNIRLEKNKFGRGALNAIKTGLLTATSDYILVVMADLSDSLNMVDGMYQKMNEGFDVVCGSRYMKGGKQIGGPLLKKTLSRLAGVSLHYLIRIPTHDITNSFKLYRRNFINQINIESNGGFEIGMELTTKAYVMGYRITEVPSTWYDRTNGESRFRMWRWMPKYLKWYFYGMKMTWFKKKGITVHEDNSTFSS